MQKVNYIYTYIYMIYFGRMVMSKWSLVLNETRNIFFVQINTYYTGCLYFTSDSTSRKFSTKVQIL